MHCGGNEKLYNQFGQQFSSSVWNSHRTPAILSRHRAGLAAQVETWWRLLTWPSRTGVCRQVGWGGLRFPKE